MPEATLHHSVAVSKKTWIKELNVQQKPKQPAWLRTYMDILIFKYAYEIHNVISALAQNCQQVDSNPRPTVVHSRGECSTGVSTLEADHITFQDSDACRAEHCLRQWELCRNWTNNLRILQEFSEQLCYKLYQAQNDHRVLYRPECQNFFQIWLTKENDSFLGILLHHTTNQRIMCVLCVWEQPLLKLWC